MRLGAAAFFAPALLATATVALPLPALCLLISCCCSAAKLSKLVLLLLPLTAAAARFCAFSRAALKDAR